MWRGLQGGYPDPPQKIFEQPETPVKKDPHVARLTSGQSRSLLSFSFMISRRSGNDQDATSASDPGAGQKAPSARPECEQRRHYCRGSKPDHFCGTSQGKHTEASIEKDCEASQTDLIPPARRAGAEGESQMKLGPRPKGHPWTPADDAQLL